MSAQSLLPRKTNVKEGNPQVAWELFLLRVFRLVKSMCLASGGGLGKLKPHIAYQGLLLNKISTFSFGGVGSETRTLHGFLFCPGRSMFLD